MQLVGVAHGGDDASPILKWSHQNGHQPEEHQDHLTLLEKTQPDVVVVCGPFERHAEMGADAIERGIHVLTEKPVALALDELDRLRLVCAKHPDIHFAGMMFSRYTPGFHTAWRMVSEGAIGQLRMIDARKSYKLGKRDSYYHNRETYGGTIPWIGSHAIDWIMWLTGKPFVSVFASHSTAHNDGNGSMERSALCHFQLAEEIFASVSIDVFRPSSALSHGDDWIRIVGTDGVIEATPDSLTLTNAHHDGSKPVSVSCSRNFLRDFVDHVDGRRPALITARDTLDLTQACLLARQSADESRIVNFADYVSPSAPRVTVTTHAAELRRKATLGR
jgi:predicted dehydrogenase